MASTTTFYRTGDTVGRVVQAPDGIFSAVYNRATRQWVDSPTFYARTLGIGGDGLDVISRDQARAIIAKGAPA